MANIANKQMICEVLMEAAKKDKDIVVEHLMFMLFSLQWKLEKPEKYQEF